LKNDGSVWDWGINNLGQLGDGTLTERHTPVQVHGESDIGFLNDIVTIDAGCFHNMAIKSDSTVWTWGWNTQGQLGDGTCDDRNNPVQVHGEDDIGFLTDIIAISGGYRHSVAVKSDGSVWSWGSNYHGELGDGTTTMNPTPVQVLDEGGIGFLSDIVQVSAGYYYSLALKSDGSLYSWGWNESGRLGNGTTIDNHTPVRVHGESDIGFLDNIVSISAGTASWDCHSLALKSDGTVWSWGSNEYGKLGDGTLIDSYTPIHVHGESDIGFLNEVIAISAGKNHSLALKANGTIFAWGSNGAHALGDGTDIDSYTPLKVHGIDDIGYLNDIIAIAAGFSFNLALKVNHSLLSWGYNLHGALGDSTTITRSTPVQVLLPW